jgi:hypothetical protein
MSEYQYYAFRAIDAPVTKKNLEFMEKQSSRAEITPWSFENEYHYGDFHGDAAEMLRRGYDFHLQYANYGIRKLMIRLPSGLSDPKAAEPYFDEDALEYDEDKHGPGGILTINPYLEPGDQDDLWDLSALIERLLPLRDELIQGDLRPLYLAWLAVATDSNHDPDEQKDAPVPAGLKKLTAAQRALTEFYGLSKALIVAAAGDTAAIAERENRADDYAGWLKRQPEESKIAWLSQLMADPHTSVRSEIMAEYQKSHKAPAWPTSRVDRTVADLRAASEGIQHEINARQAETAARNRAKKLAAMAEDPEKIFRDVAAMAEQRSSQVYHEIADMLDDLREALAGTAKAGLAEQYARNLQQKYPTRRTLTSELRQKGFLKKT